MENPLSEISEVAKLISGAYGPDAQKKAILKHFAPEAGYDHPLFRVEGKPGSREKILRLYQWYRMLSPHFSVRVEKCMKDESDQRNAIWFVEAAPSFGFSSLFTFSKHPPPARLLTRLKLQKHEDGKFYVVHEDDYYMPEDLVKFAAHPLSGPIVTAKHLITTLCVFAATLLQHLGYYRPKDERFASDWLGLRIWDDKKPEVHEVLREKDGKVRHHKRKRGYFSKLFRLIRSMIAIFFVLSMTIIKRIIEKLLEKLGLAHFLPSRHHAARARISARRAAVLAEEEKEGILTPEEDRPHAPGERSEHHREPGFFGHLLEAPRFGREEGPHLTFPELGHRSLAEPAKLLDHILANEHMVHIPTGTLLRLLGFCLKHLFGPALHYAISRAKHAFTDTALEPLLFPLIQQVDHLLSYDLLKPFEKGAGDIKDRFSRGGGEDARGLTDRVGDTFGRASERFPHGIEGLKDAEERGLGYARNGHKDFDRGRTGEDGPERRFATTDGPDTPVHGEHREADFRNGRKGYTDFETPELRDTRNVKHTPGDEFRADQKRDEPALSAGGPDSQEHRDFEPHEGSMEHFGRRPDERERREFAAFEHQEKREHEGPRERDGFARTEEKRPGDDIEADKSTAAERDRRDGRPGEFQRREDEKEVGRRSEDPHHRQDAARSHESQFETRRDEDKDARMPTSTEHGERSFTSRGHPSEQVTETTDGQRLGPDASSKTEKEVSYPATGVHPPAALPNLPAPTAHWGAVGSSDGTEDPSVRAQTVTTTQTRSAPRTPSPMAVDTEPVMFHGRPLSQETDTEENGGEHSPMQESAPAIPVGNNTTVQTTHYIPHPGATRTVVTTAGDAHPVSSTTTMTTGGETIPASAATTVNTEEVPMTVDAEPQDELIITKKKIRKPRGKNKQEKTETGQSGATSESDPGQAPYPDAGFPAVPPAGGPVVPAAAYVPTVMPDSTVPPVQGAPSEHVPGVAPPGTSFPVPPPPGSSSPTGSDQEDEYEQDEDPNEHEHGGPGHHGGRDRRGRGGISRRAMRERMRMEEERKGQELDHQAGDLFERRQHPEMGPGHPGPGPGQHPGPGYFPGPHHGPPHNARGR